jgi:glutathione S-transferase
MQLYFAPLACSMATRIVLAEAGVDATFVEVDPLTKTILADGRDYRQINPLGLVPTLRTDDGDVILENAAILTYVGSRFGAGLVPTEPMAQVRLQQWLSFISTELHTRLFSSMFAPDATEAVRAYALETGRPRLAYLAEHLTDRDHLLDAFTVADAYLVTVLHWSRASPVDLTPWPSLVRYLDRGLQRRSVEASIAIELPLFHAERRRAAEARPRA